MRKILALLLWIPLSAVSASDLANDLAATTVAVGPATSLGKTQQLVALAEALLKKLQVRTGSLTEPVGRNGFWSDRGKHWAYFSSAKTGSKDLYSISFRHRPTKRDASQLGLALWRGFPEAPSDTFLFYITNETTGRTVVTLRETEGQMVRISGTEPGTLDELIARGQIGSRSTKVLQIDDVSEFLAISDLTVTPCGNAIASTGTNP